MICGMDVYHKTGSSMPSIMALTASLNPRFTKYWSCARLHPDAPGQEISNVLQGLFTEALQEFNYKNGVYPEQIIVYRDGVGDSQRSIILQYELPQLKAALRALEIGEDECKLMVIVVNKRVNQRLFNNDNPNRLSNPAPGTVVDSGIVASQTYDFFLVSQVARVGVVSPTHYVVVYDTLGAKPETIHLLTYKLCFTYYNVSGSIKVPAPVQYAHRLSNMVGDRSSKNKEAPIPHDYFGKNIQSLYYI